MREVLILRKIVIALVATAVIAFVPTGASAEVFSMAVVSMVAVLAEVAGAAVAGVAAAELDQLRAVYPKSPESELTKALGLGRLAFDRWVFSLAEP